jgi:hypothetical protein
LDQCVRELQGYMRLSHQRQFVHLVKVLLNGVKHSLDYKPAKDEAISMILEELNSIDQLEYRRFAVKVEEISGVKRRIE